MEGVEMSNPLCPICGTSSITRSKAVLKLPEQHEYCIGCDHVFQWPPEIGISYDADYIKTYESYPTRDMSFLRLGALLSHVDSHDPESRMMGEPRQRTLLDIGYGNGEFARLAKDAGFDAYGSDVHGVDYGVKDVALDHAGRWDVVTMFDSIEHFPDFSVLRQLMVRTDMLLISTPLRPAGETSFTGRWWDGWHHFKPGEHLHYFSRKSLARLLQGFGMKQLKVEDAIRKSPSLTEPNILMGVFKRMIAGG
jgi:hypothetical protein